jgi:hypothetical protein
MAREAKIVAHPCPNVLSKKRITASIPSNPFINLVFVVCTFFSQLNYGFADDDPR